MQSDLLLAMAVLWGISFIVALLESSGMVRAYWNCARVWLRASPVA